MVSQIALDNSHVSLDDTQPDMEASTEAETLDDIFDHYKAEINYETNLDQREPEEAPYNFVPLKGILPTDINVYETYDTSTKCI